MNNYRFGACVYIGETTRGTPSPVFYDPNTPAFNNRPAVTTVTGEPGAGKTFFALNVTGANAMLGKTVVALDPKGDFLSLLNLKDDIGIDNYNVWNLRKGKAGLLDPFYMSSDPEEQKSLALEVIDIFVGGIPSEELTALSPILKDMCESPEPSLYSVVDKLKASKKQAARNLGTQLDLLRTLPFAKLCFAPTTIKRETLSLEAGLTIVSMVGLELPKEGNPVERKEKFSAGILFLLTDYVRRIMNDEDSKRPKLVLIDEAHALFASDKGVRVVKELALLGRSKNLSLIMISQNDSHFAKLNIENTQSTKFAFRTSKQDAKNIIKAMELPENEGFESILTKLDPGECLMMDFTGRYSTVQISDWNKEWKEAFNTNPLDRMNNQNKKMV